MLLDLENEIDRVSEDFTERVEKLQIYIFNRIKAFTLVKEGRKPLTAEDQQALSILENTTKLVDGRNEVGLLWKNEVSLPNNKWVAQKQMS